MQARPLPSARRWCKLTLGQMRDKVKRFATGGTSKRFDALHEKEVFAKQYLQAGLGTNGLPLMTVWSWIETSSDGPRTGAGAALGGQGMSLGAVSSKIVFSMRSDSPLSH